MVVEVSRIGTVKNQHYVPQRYLTNFSNKDKHKYKCNVFDKSNEQVRQNQNIEKIASERYFYDVDFEELFKQYEEQGHEINPQIREDIKVVDKQTMEKEILSQKVESEMFIPIVNIISRYVMSPDLKKTNPFLEEEKTIIAYYLAIQYVRTKEFREHIIQLHEQVPELLIRKKFKNEMSEEFLNELKFESSKNHISLIHNQYLIDTKFLEDIASNFLNKIWFVAVNNTEECFWTSDNPLVKKGRLGKNGFSNKGVEIIFPITPKLALIMREPEYFFNDRKKENSFVPVNEAYVKFCNVLQLEQSYRCIFSKELNFHLANEVLDKNPHLGDYTRQRYLMG